jgi:hypothetical protein
MNFWRAAQRTDCTAATGGEGWAPGRGLDRRRHPQPLRRARTRQPPLPALRLLHVLVLLTAATGALAVATDDPATTIRNLGVLTGLALLTATLTGAPLAWTVPLEYVLISAGEIDLHQDPLWAWPILPADNLAATLLATTTLIAGLTATTLRGPRDTPSAQP